jgi:hypothetical protein
MMPAMFLSAAQGSPIRYDTEFENA